MKFEESRMPHSVYFIMGRIAPDVFISPRIRRILESVFLFAAFFIKGTFTQSAVVTYSSAAEASLSCTVTTNTLAATWTEEPGAVPIYRWVNGEIRDQRGSEAKYDNFGNTKSQTSFSLVITTVEINDGGTYRCTIVPNVGATDRILTVEVPGTVTITDAWDVEIDGLDVTIGETYPLTCQATGARSVNELTLTWTPVTGTTIGVSNPPSDGETLLNYASTLQYEPQKDHTSIICTLGYFESQIPVVQVRDTVTLNVRYRPECTVEVSPIADDCTTVTLTCNCDAVPVVDSYELYQDDVLIQGTSGNTATLNIEMGQGTNSACRASNTIDGAAKFGEMANLEESYVCKTSATVAPTATKSTTELPRNKDHQPSSVGLTIGVIAGWVLASVLAVVLIVSFYYRRKKLATDSKENRRTSNVTVQERKGADKTAYMDLEERGMKEEKTDSLGHIPEQNVKVVSDFPGTGLIVYRQVNVARSSRNEDAVAKSLSDTASITLLKLWTCEIKNVLNLPKQSNVVEVIGWCDTVPNLLLTELVTGGNLLQHLSDNFSPQKLHQYGNTKRKKFAVPGKGDPDTLPKYALDVSRGIRFLLDNKFIHPGLRAEKVLVDSAGRCKLYDIVSIERAKEVATLLWSESVPYQWMSPEYLLLGTMSPTGDIWSLGVLLWEIFSYGCQPYPGESRDAVENSIRRSERLAMPQNCPGAIWQLMIQCWEQSPERRPRLGEVTSKLSTMCDDNEACTVYEEIPNQRPLE